MVVAFLVRGREAFRPTGPLYMTPKLTPTPTGGSGCVSGSHGTLRPSAFTVAARLAGRDRVFLMNTLSDAQAIASADILELLDRLRCGELDSESLPSDQQAAVAELAEHGFLTPGPEADWATLEAHFAALRDSRNELRLTVLTTVQCNCACSYCFQRAQVDNGRPTTHMSLETAAMVVGWIERQLDEVRPERLILTFFGGEPLLNLPVLYYLAERAWRAASARGVEQVVNIITNGLLLNRELVDRLAPYGLNGVKVTLDGDRETHDRLRPLRGGQPTFDRIVENVRRVADRCAISIGGNFDASSAGRYPALLDYLSRQDFAPRLARITFKPIVGQGAATAGAGNGQMPGDRPGGCMTFAGAGAGGPATCALLDKQMAMLREETKKRGFQTADGLHMGPCELHQRHAHTIGPDGSLYACGGFAGDPRLSTGHIDGRCDPLREATARRFEELAPWRRCGDCPFIPVCGGGCAVASQTELGDMNAPTCHRASFESALLEVAEEMATHDQEPS